MRARQFDATCRPGARHRRRPSGHSGAGRIRGALRHFDGGHSADHGSARSRRRRLSVHAPTRSTIHWWPGKWTWPTGPASWCRGSPPNGRSTTRTRPNGASRLRKGVKFHDGSEFNADAVIWNLDKVLNEKAPQFDKRQSAQVKTRLPSVASYAKVDDYTVEITTKAVDSSSPTRCSGSWSRARRSMKSSARTGTSSPASLPAPGRSN